MSNFASVFSTSPQIGPSVAPQPPMPFTVSPGPSTTDNNKHSEESPMYRGKSNPLHSEFVVQGSGRDHFNDSSTSGSGFQVLANNSTSSRGVSAAMNDSNSRNPFTYRGPGEAVSRHKRLHQDFKALSKEERQRLVEKEAADSDLLDRTVHLRFLPTTMKQSELAAICTECGEYLRVRICGNSTNNQNWIYGFVEFATKEAAANMMRRSGMELPNGTGRPALRLKCNAAKQPIVDRVFHDADVATATPCIFGMGNFANRSLKDALDSYFNLKAKEAQMQQQQQNGGGGMDGHHDPHSAQAAAAAAEWAGFSMDQIHRLVPQLSPHAKAFQPSVGSSVLPMGFTLNSNVNVNNHNIGGNHHQQHHRAIMESDGSSNESTTGITPRAGMPPMQMQYLDPHVNAHMSSSAVSSSTTPQLMYGIPVMPNGMPIRDGSNYLSPLDIAGGSASTPSECLLPTNTVDAAAASLSQALQSMMNQGHNGPDGEEVIQRGCALALHAIEQARTFIATQTDFYDVVGTLRTLLELLDKHSPVTGGAASTTTGDQTAELPQRVTQLRLFANLVLAFLYMFKRNLSEAIPFIHAIVTACNAIPATPVMKMLSSQSQAPTKKRSNNTNKGMGLDLSGLDMSSPMSPPGPRQEGGKNGDNSNNTNSIFAFLSDTLLQGLDDDEEDEEDTHFNKHAINNNNKMGGDMQHQSPFYERDIAFHTYVLNVLVAVGMAMEGVQPLITRSAYALAAGRARDVLNTSCPALDAFLAADQSQNPTSLVAALLPEVAGARDITSVPRAFFTAAERQRMAMVCDVSAFWSLLPPLSCIRCFQ